MRKARVGEVICLCGSYHFPHRMMGGKCDGSIVAVQQWERSHGCGDCEDCPALSEYDGLKSCQVVNGAENVLECRVFQDFARSNELKVRV